MHPQSATVHFGRATSVLPDNVFGIVVFAKWPVVNLLLYGITVGSGNENASPLFTPVMFWICEKTHGLPVLWFGGLSNSRSAFWEGLVLVA